MKESQIRILWVDDDVDFLEDMHLFLLAGKYELTKAKSYDRARSLLRQKKFFDIVVLDLIIRQHEEAGSKVNSKKENWFWGIKLLHDIREEFGLQTPILAFTVVNREDVKKQLDEYHAVMKTKGSLSARSFTDQILKLVGLG